MTEKEYNLLLQKIEKRQQKIEEEVEAVKFYKKDIGKSDRLDILKSDCERLIKSVNKIKDLQNGLIKLYKKQNDILRGKNEKI